ncbi:hypothetical protein Hanom_Chr08g00721381 [Helianthus anomalus]
MKDKGKGVEGSSEVVERSIILAHVIEKHTPLSSVPSIFAEDVSLEDLMIGNDDEDEDDDDEEVEEDDKLKGDDDEKDFSASSRNSDNDDDDAQGGTGIKVTEASSERNVDIF